MMKTRRFLLAVLLVVHGAYAASEAVPGAEKPTPALPPPPAIPLPPMPAPAQQGPAPLNSCDAGGCWSDGKRYNGGTGDIYLDRNGRQCRRNGNWIQCN